MQNIVAAIFEVESEGYQAITTLGKTAINEGSTILQMALIKREGASIKVCDSFNSGLHTNDDTLMGGLIGGLVGILGGPLGVLLMGSTGALAGSLKDAGDALDSASLMEKVADKLQDGDVALIALVEEDGKADLDRKLAQFKVEIVRFDAAAIAAEVEEAEKIQREMERQARQQLRETKKAEAKKGIEEWRNKLNAEFESFKAKFKK